MKTTIRQILCALALALPASLPGLAREPMPASGKIAVLDNDRILQGDIELVGDQYRVRRSIGETWVPASKVRHLAGSLEEAHQYLRNQTNLDDPDELLRIARWCMLHGLRAQALAEARAAVEIRPSHADTLRLVRGLQRSLSDTPAAPPQSGAAVEADTPPATLPYNPESLGIFVSRVQPILMNTCARCHATGKGGPFKLIRGHDEGTVVNRKTTMQNLMATLAQINRDRPTDSPLLSRAVTVHYGDSDQPPLKGRTAAAYRTLEEWAHLAVADMPKAPTQLAASQSPAPAVNRSATVAPPAPPSHPDPEPRKEPEPAPATLPDTPPATGFAAAPAPATEPADPFDPMIFNRQTGTNGK